MTTLEADQNVCNSAPIPISYLYAELGFPGSQKQSEIGLKIKSWRETYKTPDSKPGAQLLDMKKDKNDLIRMANDFLESGYGTKFWPEVEYPRNGQLEYPNDKKKIASFLHTLFWRQNKNAFMNQKATQRLNNPNPDSVGANLPPTKTPPPKSVSAQPGLSASRDSGFTSFGGNSRPPLVTPSKPQSNPLRRTIDKANAPSAPRANAEIPTIDLLDENDSEKDQDEHVAKRVRLTQDLYTDFGSPRRLSDRKRKTRKFADQVSSVNIEEYLQDSQESQGSSAVSTGDIPQRSSGATNTQRDQVDASVPPSKDIPRIVPAVSIITGESSSPSRLPNQHRRTPSSPTVSKNKEVQQPPVPPSSTPKRVVNTLPTTPSPTPRAALQTARVITAAEGQKESEKSSKISTATTSRVPDVSALPVLQVESIRRPTSEPQTPRLAPEVNLRSPSVDAAPFKVDFWIMRAKSPLRQSMRWKAGGFHGKSLAAVIENISKLAGIGAIDELECRLLTCRDEIIECFSADDEIEYEEMVSVFSKRIREEFGRSKNENKPFEVWIHPRSNSMVPEASSFLELIPQSWTI